MDDPLRLSGASRGVERKQHLLGIHRLGDVLGRCRRLEVVEPQIAPGHPFDVAIGPAHHHRVEHARGPLERAIRIGLERDRLAPPPALILGDEHGGPKIDHALAQGLC